MAVIRVADVEKKELRQKRLIAVLFAFCIAGFAYVGYYYYDITNRASLPEDLTQVDDTITKWQVDGLVSRFSASEAKLTVNRDRWSKLSRPERVGIVTQLARYCAHEGLTWKFKVVEDRSLAVVAEVGAKGLVVQ
jgi:hypothetical protein